MIQRPLEGRGRFIELYFPQFPQFPRCQHHFDTAFVRTTNAVKPFGSRTQMSVNKIRQ